MFDSIRKNVTIRTEEELAEAVASMSADQKQVYDLITENSLHVALHRRKQSQCPCNKFEALKMFVYGGPGCGKSYLIKTLMGFAYVETELKNNPVHFLLAAPTGIAACNIGGETLHSLWNLPVENKRFVPYRALIEPTRCRMQTNYRNVCGMIVDEISMVSNEMLMHINMRMGEVFRSEEPFGGVQMLVFGDMLQLEPPKAEPPYVSLEPDQVSSITGGVPTAVDLWGTFYCFGLKNNHRSGGEENALWRDILRRVSLGMLTCNDIDILNCRIIDTSKCTLREERLDVFVRTFLELFDAGREPLCLFPKRVMCQEFNNAVMSKRGEKPVAIRAMDVYACPKTVKKKDVQKLVKEMDVDDRDTAGLASEIVLAVGARVMNLVNSKAIPEMVNGSRGTILKFCYEANRRTVAYIEVNFDGIAEPQRVTRESRMFVAHSACRVHRKQFPLVLAYAVTIHKSQSLTLSCVFADLGDEVFCAGQSHVALSRCTTLSGLHLLNFTPRKVTASRRACINQAKMLSEPELKFNAGTKKQVHAERVWYTKACVLKAQKDTKAGIDTQVKKKLSGHRGSGPNRSKKVTDQRSRDNANHTDDKKAGEPTTRAGPVPKPKNSAAAPESGGVIY